MIRLKLPFNENEALKLKAGDEVLLSGVIYTARDAAHQRLYEAILNQDSLPFELKNQVLYYVGATPAPVGKVIGSAGPTTSGRMDAYTPLLFDSGMRACIGKGKRNEEVIQSIVKNHGIYFITIGGAGAYISQCIKKAELIAYPELHSEAIMRLEVEDFPVFVGIDCLGNNIYNL